VIVDEFERVVEQLNLMKAGEVIGEVNTAIDNLLEQIPERPEMSLERTVASLSLSIFAASNAIRRVRRVLRLLGEVFVGGAAALVVVAGGDVDGGDGAALVCLDGVSAW
jgi:hypothetical protein